MSRRTNDAFDEKGCIVSRSEDFSAAYPPWLALYLRLQFELNTLSSVAIEVPALRPAADALRRALG